MPLREQSRIPGAAVAAPQAEVLVCKAPEWCGRFQTPAEYEEREKRGIKMFYAWGSIGGPNGCTAYCSSECYRARPLNPAPEVQPVPTGYRLSDGWKAVRVFKRRPTCLVSSCFEAWPKRRNAMWLRDSDGMVVCADHAIQEGALVPIEPTAAPAPGPAPSAEWQACHEVAAAAPEGQQGEAKASECKAPAWCGTMDVPGRKFRQQSVWWNALPDKRGFCSKECRDSDAPPTAPAKVSEPGKVSERMTAFATAHVVAADVRQWAREVAALEAELAEARAMVMRRPGLHASVEAERNAARAEVEQLRFKLAESEENVERVAVRSKEIFAEAQADETKYQAEIKRLTRERVDIGNRYDLHMADCQRHRDEARGKYERAADAREAAMRAAAAKVARDHCCYYTAEAIERLPLSTGEATPAGQASEVDWSAFLLPAPDPGRIEDIEVGAVFASWTFDGTPETFRPSIRFNIGPDRNGQNTKLLAGCPDWNMGCVRLVRHADGRWARGFGQTGEAQPDAIKAAVTAATGRIADAFHAFTVCGPDHFGLMPKEEFEAWLRSGAPAPVTAGGGK